MRITETIVHPADVEQSYAMLTDPGYQELRCSRAGALDHSVTITEDPSDGSTVVTTQRHLPTTELPDFARAIVGPQLLVTETVRWGPAAADGAREGAMSIELPGTPVRFLGGVHLHATADGTATEHVVDGDLEANIPLLARRIEAAVASEITGFVRLEEQVATEWLAQRG